MKLWAVLKRYDYEGYSVFKVFGSEEKAKALTDKLNSIPENMGWMFGQVYSVEEVEGDVSEEDLKK